MKRPCELEDLLRATGEEGWVIQFDAWMEGIHKEVASRRQIDLLGQARSRTYGSPLPYHLQA